MKVSRNKQHGKYKRSPTKASSYPTRRLLSSISIISMKTIIHSALFLAFLSANPVGAVPPLSPPAANSPLNTPLEVLESKVVTGVSQPRLQDSISYTTDRIKKCFIVARGVSECSTSSPGKGWSVRCHPEFQVRKPLRLLDCIYAKPSSALANGIHALFT